MIHWLFYIIVTVVLLACSSKPATVETVKFAEGENEIRYLAWLEGDLQSDFKPYRNIAKVKLGSWAKKPPSMDNRDRYLDYLSLLEASGRRTDAEKKIRLFLAKYPEEKRAVFILGVIELRRKKTELAKYLFSQLQKDKSFPWKSLLFNNLGMIALGEGRREVAVDYFHKATKSGPAIAAPHVNLGALYLRSRSYEQAEELFDRARRIDPKFEDATLGLGIALEGQGKFEKAHTIYAKYREENPKALSVVYNDAIILGNRLNKKAMAAQLMLRYTQAGGKETAKAQKLMRKWR